MKLRMRSDWLRSIPVEFRLSKMSCGSSICRSSATSTITQAAYACGKLQTDLLPIAAHKNSCNSPECALTPLRGNSFPSSKARKRQLVVAAKYQLLFAVPFFLHILQEIGFDALRCGAFSPPAQPVVSNMVAQRSQEQCKRRQGAADHRSGANG